MTTVANKSRLIANRFKIHFLPGTAHLGKLLLVRQYGVEGLGHLVYVQEAHCSNMSQASKSAAEITYKQDGQTALQARPWAQQKCFRIRPAQQAVFSPFCLPTS
jgi:hypothetical protein